MVTSTLSVAMSSPSTVAVPLNLLKVPVTLETVRWRILNWMLEWSASS